MYVSLITSLSLSKGSFIYMNFHCLIVNYQPGFPLAPFVLIPDAIDEH